MKTLHIASAFHATSGGISTFYRALFAEAERRERPIRLVVPGERRAVEEIGRFGRIYYLKAPASPIFDRSYRLVLPNWFLPPNGSAIHEILKTERPDLVEVSEKYSLPYIAGLLRRGKFRDVPRPTLVGFSNERMDDNLRAFFKTEARGKTFARWFLGNIYLPQFDCHIANSEYTAEELVSAMRPQHRRRVAVCPMGVDSDGFTPDARSAAGRATLLDRIGADKSAVLLLYVGRLSPEKNIPLLVEVIEKLEDRRFHLLVAGGGPLAEPLAARAATDLRGRLHLLGHLGGRAELAALYANCDAFIHPNPREPFGIAPLEALAAGLPLVAPDAGGVLTYANDENAWLAEPTGAAFAETVQKLVRDRDETAKRSRAARRTAESYRWDAVTGRFFALYDELHEWYSAHPIGTPRALDWTPVHPALATVVAR
jgi:alpha-1,6-mannosyltransferase